MKWCACEGLGHGPAAACHGCGSAGFWFSVLKGDPAGGSGWWQGSGSRARTGPGHELPSPGSSTPQNGHTWGEPRNTGVNM